MRACPTDVLEIRDYSFHGSWLLINCIGYSLRESIPIDPFVAEFFTNSPGQYVKLDATISGLTGLAEGDYDDVDEQAFYLIGDMSTLKTSKTSSHGEATGKS